jgi:predicted  nucleic acid-binding Zn-ribbon protein
MEEKARAGGRYKIKEELRNKDIKIGGVLYEKVIFNRDSESLSNMLDSNEKLVSYLVADEDGDNKEAIISLNKDVDGLLEQISKVEKENKEWNARLKSAYNEMDKMKGELEMLRALLKGEKTPEKAIEKIVLNNEGMGNPL